MFRMAISHGVVKLFELLYEYLDLQDFTSVKNRKGHKNSQGSKEFTRPLRIVLYGDIFGECDII